jgi:hypothetical protein
MDLKSAVNAMRDGSDLFLGEDLFRRQAVACLELISREHNDGGTKQDGNFIGPGSVGGF